MDASSQERKREWILKRSPSAVWREFSQELDVHPLTARILYQRGFRTLDEAREFLEPTLGSMHDPFLMKDMMPAVGELLKAIDRGQRIVIHGDYDVDGTCSVALLYGFLKDLGADVDFYIPTREQDGYGLNIATVRRMASEGTGLLITTDCGISNVDEIKLARDLGMRAIIVDHHTVPDVLPPANAILNPLQKDCNYPFKELAAVGVTFNFVVAIRAQLRARGVFEVIPEPDLRRYLDLVALGTVADVMPLVGQNRTLVRLGLDELARRQRAGVSALLERASIEVGPVSARTVSFRIAPRINAAGRMADASICVDLFTTRSYLEATKLAERLENLNRARQDEERGILEDAFDQAQQQVDANRRVLVVYGEDWNRGVLGIVASRVMEEFNRPAILLGIEAGVAKGSARSIPGVNLIDVLSQAADVLHTYGGHSAAAGLSLDAVDLDSFKERVDRALGTFMNSAPMPRPRITLDGSISFSDIDKRFLGDLEKMAPFGAGNPEPILLIEEGEASNVRVVGKRHLRARFKDGTATIDGFGFAMADWAERLGGPLSMAFIPRYIQNRGRRRFEIQIKDLRTGDAREPDRIENIE